MSEAGAGHLEMPGATSVAVERYRGYQTQSRSNWLSESAPAGL